MEIKDVTKIDLGGGMKPEPGYTSLDIVGGEITMDITAGLPFVDGQIEAIFAHHFLEHVDRTQLMDVLKDCYRVLKDGGTFEVAVPDLDYALEQMNGNWGGFEMMTFAGDGQRFDVPYQYHKCAFNEARLKEVLEAVGFQLGEFDYPEYYGRNLHVIATK